MHGIVTESFVKIEKRSRKNECDKNRYKNLSKDEKGKLRKYGKTIKGWKSNKFMFYLIQRDQNS